MTTPSARLLDENLQPIADLTGFVRQFNRRTNYRHPDERTTFGFAQRPDRDLEATMDVSRNHPAIDKIVYAADALTQVAVATVWEGRLERWVIDKTSIVSSGKVSFALLPLDPYLEHSLLEKQQSAPELPPAPPLNPEPAVAVLAPAPKKKKKDVKKA